MRAGAKGRAGVGSGAGARSRAGMPQAARSSTHPSSRAVRRPVAAFVLPALLVALLLAMGLWGCKGPAAADAGASGADAPSSSAASSGVPTTDAPGSDTSGSTASTSAPIKTAAEEGALAPDFPYTTVDGASGSLSGLKGKVVLLNLWASWCGPCVREMPDIAALKASYPELEVLAVNVSDDPAAARDFITEAGYDFSWVLDEQGTVSALYPTDGIPYTIIIDADGVIGKIFLGSPPDVYATYERALKQAGL